MTRQEHLKWCKDRAMEYVANEDLSQAVSSMLSDMGKHAETVKSVSGPMTMLAMIGIQDAARGDKKAVISFIQGFN